MPTQGWNRVANFIKHTNLPLSMALGWCLLLVHSPQPASDGCIPVWGARQTDLSFTNCSRSILPLFKHQRACCSLFGATIMVFLVMWSLQFQSGYWSPAHMAALSNRCFSFVLLQSLSVQRHRAREVIHDASLFLVTVSRHKLCSGLGVNTALVLLWEIFCYCVIICM